MRRRQDVEQCDATDQHEVGGTIYHCLKPKVHGKQHHFSCGHRFISSRAPLAGDWRSVVGYEGRYSVSSDGRVKNDYTGLLIKPQVKVSGGAGRKRAYGYLGVRLGDGTGTIKNERISILVAVAFLGPRPEGYEINHIDGNKANNAAGNLEYVSPKENRQHASRIGLNALGTRHGSAKLTESQVREIRAIPFNDRGGALKELTKRLGISRGAVTSIRMGKTWRHIA